ncbi:MAG: arylesterase [Burkholderiaceae bacterium]|nr:arylesterase [Burkholderiaceae bacterium]
MKALAAVLLAAAWLAGCTRAESPLAGCHLPTGATVLAIGDSLTRGQGADGDGYAEQLQQRVGDAFTVVQVGINGERSEGLLARIDDALAEHRPGLVFVTSGGNDLLRRVPAERTLANLRELAARIRAAGAVAVIFAVPQPGLGAVAGLLDDHPMFDALAGDLHVIPGVVSGVLGNDALKADAIHPNRAGYTRLADAAEAVLQRCR